MRNAVQPQEQSPDHSKENANHQILFFEKNKINKNKDKNHRNKNYDNLLHFYL